MLKKVIRYTLKSIVFLFLIFILTCIALIFIIKVPSVQNKIIHSITHYIAKKTHTIVTIGEAGISFPKSVYIKHLYLADQNKDTLLSVGSIIINIDLADLIKNKLHIHQFKLENTCAYIARNQGDSLFNFDFLIKAFTGKKSSEKTDTTSSAFQLQVDEIQIKQLAFHYLDSFEQVMVKGFIGDLLVSADKTDIQHLDFNINNLNLKNSSVSVSVPKQVHRIKKKIKSPANPMVSVENLQLTHTDFSFHHGTDSLSLAIYNVNLQLKHAFADLKTNSFGASLLSLNDSKTNLNKKKLTSSLSADSETTSSSAISVTVNEIQLKNNYFSYTDRSKPTLSGFDPGHFQLKNIEAGLKDAWYKNYEISATVKNFLLKDGNGFEIRHLSGKLAYLKKGMVLDGIQLETGSSQVAGNFSLKYQSISDLKNNLTHVIVGTHMKIANIHSRDLIYFVPSLDDVPYFSAHTSTVMEAEISGPVGLLLIKKLRIQTGQKTSIYAALTISGLPDIRHAVFNMPGGMIKTTKNDLIRFLPKGTIPQTLDLPENIHADINFNGNISTFKSQLNLTCDYGKMNALVDLQNSNNYKADVELAHFNAGRLLRKTELLGEMSFQLQMHGSGFKRDSIQARVTLHVDDLGFNSYVYHNLDFHAQIKNQLYDFGLEIKDTSVQLVMEGKVDLNSDMQLFKLNGKTDGINFHRLHILKEDIRLAADFNIDIQRDRSSHYLQGNASVTNLSVNNTTHKYFVDSAFILSVTRNESDQTPNSNALSALYINGDFEPVNLQNAFLNQVNEYFKLANVEKKKPEQNFVFRLKLNNHPVIEGILLKDLHDFRVDDITGRFSSRDHFLSLNASLSGLNYSGIIASNTKLMFATDSSGLQISLQADNISRDPVFLNALNFKTVFYNQQADISLSTGKEADNNKLAFNVTLYNQDTCYRLNISDPVTINSLKWTIPSDNEIVFAKKQAIINQVRFENYDQAISISKKGVYEDLVLNFKNFGLGNFSRILNRDTLLADGTIGGVLIVKNDGGLVADLNIDNLQLRSQMVGNIHADASSLGRGVYDVNAALSGNDNDVDIQGTISIEKDNQILDLIADIRKANLKSIEPFTMGQLRESDGMIKGKITVKGTTKNPVVSGGIDFVNVSAIPAFTNNKIYLKNEHVDITDESIQFPSLSIRDKDDHLAIVTGEIRKKGFTDFKFDLNLSTKNFIFLNTTRKDNELFYGNLLADCEAKLTGDFTIPKLTANINVLKGTHFTFSVQQNQSSTDKGEGILLFTDSQAVNPIMITQIPETTPKSEIKGMDLTANVKIDPEAVLTVLIDPVTGDSLSVRGDASLSFALDEGGKISLTGRYELTDGSYLVTLQQLIHRKFQIQKGSTITWNGDPLDADLNITAIYKVNTSPVDLIANETGTLSDEELNSYKRRLPFEVNLILKDNILKPDISFTIELQEAYRGAMGGIINSKLNLLKEDPSELNKQVFALLIFNRFIQQDPFTSASGSGAESVARMSVGKFLSQELNNLSAQYIKGVELNVDVQSYENSGTSSGGGTTEVELGVKKEFFNERLSVQVGGTIDVEGAAQKSNQSGDLTGNMIIEYKLTPDGRYRLKGFRQNEYDGFIDGQLIETGVGIIYSIDFGKWKEITTPPRKDNDR